MKVCSVCNMEKNIDNFYFGKYKTKNREVKKSYHPECKECRKDKSRKWSKENRARRLEIQRKNNRTDNSIKNMALNSKKWLESGKQLEYQRNNRNKIIMYEHNRRALNELLPNTLTEKDVQEIKKHFKNRCGLTQHNEFDMDHFIPLSWGHGGSYKGNLYPLQSSLNKRKKSKNPFVWINESGIRKKVAKDKFIQLVAYLAELNSLTVFEFTAFVFWCENNKRSIEEIKKSGSISSIELWRKSETSTQ